MSGNINISNSSSQNTYDELPYESYPYSQTHPRNLRTAGMLFGMNPPPLENARVLELGCSAGNNIIPFATDFPKGHITGIDLSAVQINQAQETVKSLGLKNAKFHHLSIMDIDKDFGEFDYIIAHGVISWVPVEVQEKIFDICKNNLSKNGVAYVSYNTLPGWNMVRSIRDMMLYHTESFPNPIEKVQQARLLLQFIIDATETSNTPYAQVLKNEAKVLANQPDHYLRHDHIEENNTQYYFHDFVAKASLRNLQYLSDANIPSMYLGNMPKGVIEKLQAINDIVRTEQYMDFINNRRFRCTLLCHDSVKLNRALNNDDIKNFYLSMNIDPEVPLQDTNLEDNTATVKFFVGGSKENYISSSAANMKAILYSFAENKNSYMKVDTIVKSAASKLKDGDRVALKAEIVGNAMKLVLSGYISISCEEYKTIDKVSEKPKASKIALYQAASKQGLWLTTQKHERLGINLFEKYVIKYLDGNHTKEEILAKLLEHINSDELTVSQNGEKITDINVIKSEISKVLDETLNKLIPLGVLVA